LNLFDYLLLAIVGCSMVLSLWRGFVREVISLVGLTAAFVVAGRTSGLITGFIHGWIPNDTVANLAAFGLIFVAVMLIVSLIGMLIHKLVNMADLTATDRTLGMVFGLARGLLLIALFFLIYTSYTKPDSVWMKNSRLTPYAIHMGDMLGRIIPEGYPFSRQGKSDANGDSNNADIPASDKLAVESIIKKAMQ
jgi:membrane protein required for colicin V production